MTNRELVERQIDAGNRFAVDELEQLEMYERGDWVAVDVRVRMRGRGSGAEVEARGGRAYELRAGKIARYVHFQSMDDAKAFVDAAQP